MALHSDLPVYASARDLSKLISQVVAKMQRDYKFTLGKRLDEQCFELVMDVFRANTAEDKAPTIRKMRESVVAIELSMRLAEDLGRMPRKDYARAILLTGSIGKQLTGWLRHSETRQQAIRQGGRSSVHR